jgi:WD40-like Beta Propeller Repeat
MTEFTIGGLTRALVCLAVMHSTCFAKPHAAAPELSTASLRPQLFAGNAISTANDESHPAFTPDGKTLYFLKNDPSFNHWTIVVSHEQNATAFGQNR